MNSLDAVKPKRMTALPQDTFVACTALPLKQRLLSKKDAAQVEGGNPLVIGIVAGVAANAIYNHWQEEIDGAFSAVVNAVDEVIDSHSRFLDQYVW